MNPDPARPCLRWAAAIVCVTVPVVTTLANEQSPDLAEVLRRAAQVVARYAEQSAAILAEESCEQRAYQAAKGVLWAGAPEPVEKRRWKAELALVQLPGSAKLGLPWIEVRDVFEVDGKRLPDRQERLERLILTDPDWKETKAREVTEESARFNIGQTRRNTNTPSVPLLLLCAPNQLRFNFAKTGEETIGGVRAWRVTFEEMRRPTFIRAAGTGGDMPSAGTFWIDAGTGEVLRAELRCGASSENDVRVEYRAHPRFGLRLPFQMIEKVVGDEGRSWVEGKCTYSDFRRFETGGKLVVPK
jgi:hypothetical protein